MKFALIADIHSNIEAFDAVLAHATTQGAQRIVLLGDLVGYGPDPEAVIERSRALVADGAIAVLGNHDASACGRDPSSMNDEAESAILWTRARLKPDQMDWLAGLPHIVREGEMTWVHASASRPQDWLYVSDGKSARASLEAAGTTWVFGGHVHDPTLYYTGRDGRMLPFHPTEAIPVPVPRHRRWLAIVGSCGQPRDRQVGARYALFDQARATLSFHRVAYDHASTAARIRAAGLSERFARHVEGLE